MSSSPPPLPTTLKIVLAGSAPAVGVTNIMQTYIRLPFEEERSRTTSADCQMRKQDVLFNAGSKEEKFAAMKLNIFDTPATTESTRVANLSVCRGAHALIVVFDLSSPSAADALEAVRSTVETYSEAAPQAAVILVGNKRDLVVHDAAALAKFQEQAQALAADLGLGEHACIFSSAKTDLGSVDAVFDEAIVAGCEALGFDAAVVADEDDEDGDSKGGGGAATAPAIGSKPGAVDPFAPQLVERESVPLHPPVLVPHNKKEENNNNSNDKNNDDDKKKSGQQKQESKNKTKSGSDKIDDALQTMQLIAQDARTMLSLLRTKGIVFRGRVLSTESSSSSDSGDDE